MVADAGAAEVLLHHESNERWLLDPAMDWQISKLELIEQAGGQPRTEAVMRRPHSGNTDGPMLEFMMCYVRQTLQKSQND